MKAQLTLFCLMGGALVVEGAFTTTEFVQDKPSQLLIARDTFFTDSYRDSVTRDNGGGIVEGQLWHHDDYQWQDGIGGTGSRQDTEQSDNWDGACHLWGSTNHTSSHMNWPANGTGTESYTANDGSTTIYEIDLPPLISEHCLVNDPQTPPLTVQSLGDGNWATNQVYEEYLRRAQTRWRLQTGGRAGHSSLFRLSATAAQILDKRAQRPFESVASQSISPQSITVMGRALYADTNLWLVLPNGTNLDVTPLVAGLDFYRMDVVAHKYAAHISINNISLDAGTPEFCAGQYLDFKLVLEPTPMYVAQVAAWDLPGPPLNESWRESATGSVNYRFNPDLLTNLTTSCWYASGGGRTASLGALLQFTNGQCCLLNVEGHFSIARPSLSDFDNCASLIGFVWSPPILQANMQWAVIVQSAYDGNLGVTQLIQGTNLCCNTGGEFRLDGGSEIYQTTPTNLLGQTYNAADPATHTARLLCSPNSTASPTVDLTATFKDYLRFRPDGNASNIWVTLATNSWSMDGAANLSCGLTRSNLPPAGALHECEERPSWTNTYQP
jgi:hypothetical protein